MIKKLNKEILFIGRSNVGKSSLINSLNLSNHKVKTSRHAVCLSCRSMCFFILNVTIIGTYKITKFY